MNWPVFWGVFVGVFTGSFIADLIFRDEQTAWEEC